MGRVLFTAKAEPAKAGPAIDWSEIESRLHEISAGIKPAGDEPSDLVPEASATLGNDPSLANAPRQRTIERQRRSAGERRRRSARHVVAAGSHSIEPILKTFRIIAGKHHEQAFQYGIDPEAHPGD